MIAIQNKKGKGGKKTERRGEKRNKERGKAEKEKKAEASRRAEIGIRVAKGSNMGRKKDEEGIHTSIGQKDTESKLNYIEI